MDYFRNVLLFMVFAVITAGCGGGNTTISNNSASGSSINTGSGGTTTTGTGSGSGSVSLQWTPPTTAADGTTAISLSDISGYRLFYGSSSTNTPNMISITSGATTQTTITLPKGTYYFVICAIDNNGVPGLKSLAIQKIIS